MLVTLIGKEKKYELRLPEEIDGSYWIRDENEKAIFNIKGEKNNWIIASDENAKIINPQNIKSNNGHLTAIQSEFSEINKTFLKEYGTYFIVTKNSPEVSVLYCTSDYENNSMHFEVNSSEISIGRTSDNDISYNYPLINKNHCRIFLDSGIWKIENFDTNIGTFLNDIQINDKTIKIKSGDIIQILGIKIIFLRDTIHMFGELNRIKYNVGNLHLIKEFYDNEVNDKIKNSKNAKLYSENDYFYRAPNIIEKIEDENINIDPPPQKEKMSKADTILSLASSLAMGSMGLVMLANALNKISAGTLNKSSMITTLMMPIVMIFASLVIPLIKKIYENKKKKKYEKDRQYRYKKYINKKIMEINKIMEKQAHILTENNIDANECERIILENDPQLWKRKITDEDFLSVRLGKGDSKLNIQVSEPKDKFSMDEDNLNDIYINTTNESRTLKNVPISCSLLENNITGLVFENKDKVNSVISNIMVQLVALHAYSDLKLCFLVKNDSEIYEYAKMFPHVWDDSKEFRFFADNYQDMKKVSNYLENEFIERTSPDGDNKYLLRQKDYKEFSEYYLIITNDYMKIYNLGIINKIIANENNVGFSLLCITNNINQLPTETKLFIEIDDKKCRMMKSDGSEKEEFDLEKEENFDFEQINKIISNIPIKMTSVKGQSLPSKYSFLEMFKCGNIDQLNIYDRWNNSDSTSTLQAQIGIDSAGQPIYLDAHEKFHGPHGLIAGTTGSGKSEFIITYILSLAINYHPDDITFVLIDYKGGGLAGAFKRRDIQLPHLVGTITNIDQVRSTKVLRINRK